MKCKLKKYIILGSVLFLFVASCNRNENGETSKEAKNNKEVVKMPDKDQIEKYSEYAELKKVTFTEEWNDNIFKEIFQKEFIDAAGKYRKPSNKSIQKIVEAEDTVVIFEDYIKDIEKVLNKDSKIEELDKEAKSFLEALINEKNIMKEIIDYYKKKEYEKDSFKKGEELAAKYIEATAEKEKAYDIYSQALDSFSIKVGKNIYEKSVSEGKKATANMIDYMNELNKFSGAAFNKENLKFSDQELKNLKEIYVSMEKTYKNLENTSNSDIEKEKIDKEEFEKIRKDSSELMETAKKMIESTEKNNQKDTAVFASKFLNTYSKTVDSYNIIVLNSK